MEHSFTCATLLLPVHIILHFAVHYNSLLCGYGCRKPIGLHPYHLKNLKTMATKLTTTAQNHTTTMVCRYIQESKQLSHRAIARILNIHHSTWQRYSKGLSSPEAHIKQRMVKLMQVGSYTTLIQEAISYTTHNRVT